MNNYGNCNSKKMATRLKILYIFILKYKYTVERQGINTSRSDYYYFIELESPHKMLDEHIYLTKVK